VATQRVDSDGESVVKATIARWHLSAEEETLFASARDLPNWRLADKARRMAADYCVHFSEQMPQVVGLSASEIDGLTNRRWAVVTTVAIGVRSASAAMMLIAAGYLPESGAPARRMIEAGLNSRAILADASGQYAATYLKGRARKLSKLATEFGSPEEIAILSMVAHADARALTLAYVQPPAGDAVKEGTASLLPSRDIGRAHDLLYAIAYECAIASSGLAEAFSVAIEIPPWISGELLRLRDLFERRATSGDGDTDD
jgi:hypothetical protein